MTTIEKIHMEFDTAQDRLLEEAKKILATTTIDGNIAIESMALRLRRIGFVNTPVAKKADEIGEQKVLVSKKLVSTKKEAEKIEYYKQKYPFLKFLTTEELDRICKKYDLVYAPIEYYVKDVPEKNINDIENAQSLLGSDAVGKEYFCEVTEFYDHAGRAEVRAFLREHKNMIPCGWRIEQHEIGSYIRRMGYTGGNIPSVRQHKLHEIDKSGLFIAAPSSHFDKKGLTKKGLGFFSVFTTEVTDPIVFRYVQGGIQVITKWGEEANDPALVVPLLN